MTTTTANHDSNSTAGNAPAFTHERSEFTPGPWRFESSTMTIRSVPANYWLATMDSWDRAVNHEANARLIAAAPELLEALKRAERCLNLTRIQFMQAPLSASLPTTAASIGDDLFAVRAAIAKAEDRA